MKIKRLFDISLSIFGLITLSPVFLLVTILIKLRMPGPVFFSQDRVGKHGKPFRIYKFRSMVINKDNISITLGTDSRITPLGRWLRRTKIDEFPQLWNILKGDMSFVGPRPDVPGYADKLAGEERLILSVKPGLTGADSVAYPYEEELLQRQDDPERYYDEVLYPDKVRINLEYIKNRNFWLDIKLIILTLFPWKRRQTG